MIKQIVTPLLVVASLLVPAAYGDRLVEFGVIDRVDYREENALVIDDQYYPMALNMVVKDEKGATATRYALKKGQKVRFNVTDSNQVDKIWLLAASATRPRDN